jgi:isoquinoline 1-oxidoreductase beta subunit
MSAVVHISRRGFLGSVLSAGALVLTARVFPTKALGTLAAAAGAAEPWYPSVYLGIEPSGTVTIVAHRSEMGTGIRTVLPMVAADELDADWQQVRIEQALGDPQYGDQNTDRPDCTPSAIDLGHHTGAKYISLINRARLTRR